MTIQEKKALYTAWINQLRRDKLKENQKKLAYEGYSDEDDYHMLCPPDGWNWKPPVCEKNGEFYGYTAWAENYRALTESFPPSVIPYSSMAGNFFRILHKYRKVRWNLHDDFSIFNDRIERYDIDHGIGQVHHFCGDVRIGLRLGWGGLLEKVQRYAKTYDSDTEKQEFYCAEISFVKSIIAWIRRTADYIETLIPQEKDPQKKENLCNMLETNRQITTGIPRTLREACQFISWYNIAGRCYNREGCGGQLDAILKPYYDKDISEGLIDNEDAVFYIAGLLMSDTKYYQLGGPDENGKDITNEVSWLIIEAADRLNLTCNLTVRVFDGLDRAFFHKSVEMLVKHKNAWPRFSGDNALTKGFIRFGYDAKLARKRIAVGCNWMAIPGIEYCLNDSIKVNLAKIFEVAFDEVSLAPEPNTEKLWACYERHLREALKVVFETTDFHIRTNRYNSPELFLNLFTVGPIEKGQDASDHSLDYYNIGVDGAGIAVAADSFAALEQRVEREKRITWTQVLNAVRCNYSGPYLKTRALMQSSEKFGQYESLGLKWAKRISALFSQIVAHGTSQEGLRFIPGLFSWSKTIRFGQTVGATPDGRLAGEPINHGANPMPGSVKSGDLTTMSEAIAAIQCGYGNTAPFQLELDPAFGRMEDGVEKLMAFLETHLRHGGTLININIVDAEKVLAAHKDPSLYPDLVVRVTGFTAYFASLSPDFRKLVVDRMMRAV